MVEERTQYNCIHDEVPYGQYPCNVDTTKKGICGETCIYWAPKPEPPKPKGIDILMTCGETHHIDTEQPSIESVKVNGEQVYPKEEKMWRTPQDEKQVVKMLNSVFGGAWCFRTNTSTTIKKHINSTWADNYYPEKKYDLMFYPTAWDVTNRKLASYIGVYVREK